MKKHEDRQLIVKAKSGDIDAFVEVFESMRPLVFNIAYRLVGPSDADDVVMEVYLKVWKKLSEFNFRSTLTTWVYRMVYNTAIDMLRQQRRYRQFFLHDWVDENFEKVDWIGESEPSPRDELEHSELISMVDCALKELDDAHRITLLLRYTDGLSYNEIAAATGVGIGTVMSRIYNGKKKLKKLIIQQEADYVNN